MGSLSRVISGRRHLLVAELSYATWNVAVYPYLRWVRPGTFTGARRKISAPKQTDVREEDGCRPVGVRDILRTFELSFLDNVIYSVRSLDCLKRKIMATNINLKTKTNPVISQRFYWTNTLFLKFLCMLIYLKEAFNGFFRNTKFCIKLYIIILLLKPLRHTSWYKACTFTSVFRAFPAETSVSTDWHLCRAISLQRLFLQEVAYTKTFPVRSTTANSL
jgi:hypothetical protein